MKPPVFVVGCARSGTTWVQHLLISSGRFLNYRAETHFFDLFLARFGSPADLRNRERLADAWLGSTYHERTGLGPDETRAMLLRDGSTPGRFLSGILDSAAERQGVERWVDATPGHAGHLPVIASEFPEARFIHVIRDGRDVAVSLAPRGWVNPLPWDRGDELLVAGWRWERIVHAVARGATGLGDRLLEVRFEDLVEDLEGSLGAIGRHIDEELDPEAIRRNPVGSVARPNTSFADSGAGPVGRWRSLDERRLEALESGLAGTLRELGYEPATTARGTRLLGLRKGLDGVWSELRAALRRTPPGRRRIDPLAAAPPEGPAD